MNRASDPALANRNRQIQFKNCRGLPWGVQCDGMQNDESPTVHPKDAESSADNLPRSRWIDLVRMLSSRWGNR
jgi:hypothetical protein